MRCFCTLIVGILAGTLASAVLAEDLEYPDYIYVDLGWTDSASDCIDCDYGELPLRTIRYDDFDDTIGDVKSLESRLLFRLNNMREVGGTETAQVAGWIDTNVDPNLGDELPGAHVWTIKIVDGSVIMTPEELDSNSPDTYSWATAISDNGYVAGMVGNTDEMNQDITWHKAAVWETHGSNWQRSKADPHAALRTAYDDDCNGPGYEHFESGAFGIIDMPGKDRYSICGACDAGCSVCPHDTTGPGTYMKRAFRWSPSGIMDVLYPGRYTSTMERFYDFQIALSFYGDDVGNAVGRGRYWRGNENPLKLVDENCAPLPPPPFPWCHHPSRLPTTFEFSQGTSTEYIDFIESPDRDGGDDHYLYNAGSMRDALTVNAATHVTGHVLDNLDDDDLGGASSCSYRATYRNGLGSDQSTIKLPNLPFKGEMDTRSHQGYGIGILNGRLQIVGHADATWNTNEVALLWQQDASRQWSDILDLNEHLADGHINLHGLDPRINRHTFTLLSAHDVNDSGWIVGIAQGRYCRPEGSEPGDGPKEIGDGFDDWRICSGHGSNDPDFGYTVHLRPYLLIPRTSWTSCGTGRSCPGDINGDGEVNGSDLGLMINDWHTTRMNTDLNCDGVVNGADLGLLFANWGPCWVTCQ